MRLGRTKEMSSISNMPQQQTGVAMAGTEDYVWDVYQKSVKMSTYLVAFVVSKFQHLEAERLANNVTFRIWSLPASLDQTAYAGRIGPRVLEHFENYFQVPFPLPKQDMIAIPDFGAGAMENWGLITYRWTLSLWISINFDIDTSVKQLSSSYLHSGRRSCCTRKVCPA